MTGLIYHQSLKEDEEMKGTVKWFNVKKGYGFITTEEGEDIFVHYSEIKQEGFKKLSDGDAVEFEITEDGAGKKKAVSVTQI